MTHSGNSCEPFPCAADITMYSRKWCWSCSGGRSSSSISGRASLPCIPFAFLLCFLPMRWSFHCSGPFVHILQQMQYKGILDSRTLSLWSPEYPGLRDPEGRPPSAVVLRASEVGGVHLVAFGQMSEGSSTWPLSAVVLHVSELASSRARSGPGVVLVSESTSSHSRSEPGQSSHSRSGPSHAADPLSLFRTWSEPSYCRWIIVSVQPCKFGMDSRIDELLRLVPLLSELVQWEFNQSVRKTINNRSRARVLNADRAADTAENRRSRGNRRGHQAWRQASSHRRKPAQKTGATVQTG